MTRIMSAILALYFTLGLVQIPYVQAQLPGYVREIVNTDSGDSEDEEAPETYYLSIVVPGTNFDPQETEQEIYSKNLKEMDYKTVDGMLKKLPGITQESRDSYTLNNAGLEISISLYLDKTGDRVSEIEFQLPMENLDHGNTVAEVMVQLAEQIPGSRLFDYTGKKLYPVKDKDKLVRELQAAQGSTGAQVQENR